MHSPEGAVWFGLQKRASDHWQRCERADWAPDERWWKCSELEPYVVALKGFGPGTYRVVWAAKDRRKKSTWKFSEPFEAQEPVAPTPPVAPATERLHAVGLERPMSLDPMSPMALPFILFDHLHRVSREDRQAERERDLHMWTLMLETMRGNHQVTLSQLHQFHDVMSRANSRIATEQADLDRQNLDNRIRPLHEQIAATDQRMQQLVQALTQRPQNEEDDEDDDDAEAAALARIGENPTDGERVLQGIASIMQTISTFAQTPMGEALAKRFLSLEPDRVARPRPPMSDAAE